MAISNGPSANSVDITPHATNPIPIGRGIHVNVGGDVAGRLVGASADQTFTFAGGITHPYVFQYVRVAGTTATGLKVAF